MTLHRFTIIMVRMESKGRFVGYILGIVAAAAYGMNPLFALPLYESGMNPDSVLFFRYLFAIPLMGVMLVARGRGFRLTVKECILLAVLGLTVAVSSLSLFMSYNYMEASIASTLLFVYPIMVAVIMAVAYRERLSWVTLASMVLALGGIAMLYRGGDGASLSMAGTVLVFVSSLSYAAYIVVVNKSRLSRVATLKVTFYILLFGLMLFSVRICTVEELVVPDMSDWYIWFNLAALAALPTALSFLCTTAAIQRIGATPAAILGAFEPVTAIVFGVTVFGERLTGRDILGIVMIIVAVSAVVASGSVMHYIVRLRRLFPRLPKRH